MYALVAAAERELGSTLVKDLAGLGYRVGQVRLGLTLDWLDQEWDGPPNLVIGGLAGHPGLLPMLTEAEPFSGLPLLLVLNLEDLGALSSLRRPADFLVHPYSLEELSARLTLIRNRILGNSVETLTAGRVSVNMTTYRVTAGDLPVDLTYMEYELLRFLITHPEQVFTRPHLLSAVWGQDYLGGPRTVDVHIRRLRAKLGLGPEELIQTVRGVGYRVSL
ncbi:MAG TPA: response regulator transcription factor [Dehalococcoidia bacterium]|nr:response regulator transcription factor [Dehalococcoidia bacterium]